MQIDGTPAPGTTQDDLSSAVLERIPHGIFTVDRERRITGFNPAAEEITGWRREEVLGRPCQEIFRSDHCRDRCFLLESVRSAVAHRDREVRIRRRDGRSALVSVTTAALPGGQAVEMFRDLGLVERLRQRITGRFTVNDVVHRSEAMARMLRLVPLVARSECTVLIQGEPGTGKELVARAIHNAGARREAPFVAVNCGAIPENLVESELFGHRRGAFTDARQDRAGRFAEARGGTLLLDEIGELTAASQVKLLRVLQEREFTPLGAERSERADVRVLAATNRDLAADVASGRFRRDLYFRLNVVRLTIPPLRERPEEIPLLASHFVSRFNEEQGRFVTGLSEEALGNLLRHGYPGNVRELENAIEHAFVMCSGDEIRTEHLPLDLQHVPAPEAGGRRPELHGPLGGAEAAAIREALEACDGNRSEAARRLRIARNTLWRKMRRHGIL